VIGLLLLVIATDVPLWVLSGVITLVYAFVVPLAAISMTLLYGDAVAESDDRQDTDDARAELIGAK
jgi:hypothetical protein